MKATTTKKSGITVNDMIYNTLTTKGSKEPKYRNVLEAFGYTLTNQHDWSDYDYWGIQCADGSVLVISKTYGNERGLFKTARLISTKNIKKVNFVGLIESKRERFSFAPFAQANLVTRYQDMKQAIQSRKWLVDYKEKEVEKLKLELNKATETLMDYKKSYAESVEKLEAFKQEHLKKGDD